MDSNRAVTLTLTNGPSPWYFRIGGGSCTTVSSGNTVSNIKGYQPGYHPVGAFATAGCKDFLADAGFVIPDPPRPTATLTTTVNPGPSVNLTLTNGPSNNNWWFKINWWGGCTAVTGTNTVNNIQGYAPGTHSVDAYSDSGCETKIASSSFIIPDPTLTITVNDDRSVDLTLAGGPTDWWFRIGWWGNCTAASGTSVNGIRGYPSGSYIVAVYPDSKCEFGEHITAESFTIPTATLTATVQSDRSVNLNLSNPNGPDNWWFRINSWGICTATSGTTVSNIRGYQPGTYTVKAYSNSGCNYHVAATTFTIVPPALTVSAVSGTGATLTIANHSGQWWYQADTGPDNTCQAAGSATTKTLTGLTPSTTYTYSAYSDSTCATLLATADAFTALSPSLTATSISGTGATLNIANHSGAWYYKRTAGPADTTCNTVSSGTTATLSSLTADTFYAYTAYSASGCTTELDAAYFSTTDYGVGNLDETASSFKCSFGFPATSNNQCAIAFTTGTESGGYTLTSITGRFSVKGSGATAPINVAIHAADSNNSINPAATAIANATFSGSDPDTAGLYTYTCSGNGCDLAASTTYFVVMSTTDTVFLNYYNWELTESDAEAAHPSTNGWTIANAGRVKIGAAAWSSLTGSLVNSSPLLHIAASPGTVSVSSLGNSSQGFSTIGNVGGHNRKRAAQFTTGANTGGYNLSSATVQIGGLNDTPGNLVVAIYTDSSGKPGSSQITLSGSNPTGGGQYTYTCSSSCALSASTPYHLVLSAPNATGTTSVYEWRNSSSSSETLTPSNNGWSIGNSFEHTGSWATDSNTYLNFKVTATLK